MNHCLFIRLAGHYSDVFPEIYVQVFRGNNNLGIVMGLKDCLVRSVEKVEQPYRLLLLL